MPTKQERQDARTTQAKLDQVNARIVNIQNRLDIATAAGNSEKIEKRTARLAKVVARKAELEA